MVTAESLVIGDDMESDNDTDWGCLLKKAREGDDGKAFGQFVLAAETQLHRHCFLLTREYHSACDLFQDTILAVWMKLKKFDPNRTATAKAWVFRIARNTFLTPKRTKAARISPLSLETISGLASREPDPAKAIDEANPVLRLLGQLEDHDREVIVLKYDQGMSLKEISEILDLSVQGVASRLLRAKARLRKLLEDEERGPTAA